MCVARREGARKLAIYGGHEDGRGAQGEARGVRFVGNLLTPSDLAKHTHSLPTETFHLLKYHQSVETLALLLSKQEHIDFIFILCILYMHHQAYQTDINDTHTNITK